MDVVGTYIRHWARRPLSKVECTKLRVKYPRLVVLNKVCETPAVAPKLVQFLTKMGWNSKRGLKYALRVCEGKLLDLFDPVAIFELEEAAKFSDEPVNPYYLFHSSTIPRGS